MATLKLRTQSQVVLFKHELSGQISDGHWENLNVRDHWQAWCECDVEVGTPVGRDFWVRYDRYNFCAKDLLDVVGKRMIAYVRLAKAFSPEAVEVLEGVLDLDGNYTGLPSYEGKYWEEKRAKIQAWLDEHNVTLERVSMALSDQWYGQKELLVDLREIKKAIKIRNR